MHIPVLKNQVLRFLDVNEDRDYIDATAGFGGHIDTILENNGPLGRVLGIEWDKELYEKLKQRKQERLTLVNDSYTNLKNIAKENKFDKAHGIILDFGFSSWHIQESGRGFTFQKDELLDMRFNKDIDLTAYEIVNSWPKEEIDKILLSFGEERFSKQIAKNIVAARKKEKIKTTFQLAEVIKNSIPRRFHFGKIHPATRSFQALRMTVNKELENINKVLPQTLEVLKKRGRIVVISFHSLEDRIMKNFFRDNANKGKLEILTKKPIIADEYELEKNPKSRSAKLRAAIKT